MASIPAQQSLHAALRQLGGLTSLAATLASWPRGAVEQGEGGPEQPSPYLDVTCLLRLAVLRLSRGGVAGLSSCQALTWLELEDTEYDMEDLCACRRLVGMRGLLHTFNACLEDYLEEDPDLELGPPPACLPALRSLSLREDQYDRHYPESGPVRIPDELSALTSLTQLQIEGNPVKVSTEDSDGYTSDQLEKLALRTYEECVPAILPPSHGFCLPHLRELSMTGCSFETVPSFVAGLPALRTLRLSGNLFKAESSSPRFFPGLPGPICSGLQRLELRGCFLRTVPPFLSHLTALTALDLSGNRTLEIRRSDADIFSRLTRLRELRLARPPSLTRKEVTVEWRQASVAALLGVQRACAWLDMQAALEPEETEAA